LDERRRIDLGDFGLAGDQQLNRLQRALRDENFNVVSLLFPVIERTGQFQPGI